ncbi:MAG: hypothetical protein P8X81_12615 [Woeseiaceae bacterium]
MKNRIATMALAALALSGCGTPLFDIGQQPTAKFGRTGSHMPESIRTTISSVSVHAGSGAPSLYVGGDYGEPTMTAGEGAKAGAAAGVLATGEMMSEDLRATILVPIVLPIAVVAGSIVGGAAAKVNEQVREFRDELTDELLDESNPELPSAELAHELEGLLVSAGDVKVLDDSAADASLTITLTEISIVVDGNDAEMSATARAVLQGRDGRTLYSITYGYWDRNSLSDWVANDNALWNEFRSNARRHIARVVSSELFESITTRHVLRPVDNEWQRRAKSSPPVLAWDFVLLGGDEYDGTDIADNPIHFDLEVYDGRRLVYAARDIPEARHEIAAKIARCRTLSWSVRPLFEIGGRKRAGEWMNQVTFWGANREYWDGLAEIRTRCGK